MFSRFNAYANKKQLIGYAHLLGFDPLKEHFTFSVMDSISEEGVEKALYKRKNVQGFINDIPKPANYNNCFKAIIINLFGLAAEIPITNLLEYFKILKAKFNALKIPSYFITQENSEFSSLLIATKTEMNFGESVVLMLTEKGQFKIAEFKFTPSGYQLIQKKFLDINIKAKSGSFRQKILGSLTTPRRIIFPDCIRNKKKIESAFKGMNYAEYECCKNKCCEEKKGNNLVKIIIEISKWMFDKSSTEYHIILTAMVDMQIFGYFGSEKHILDIFGFERNESLPITKSAIISKSVPEIKTLLKYNDESTLTTKQLQKDCHRIQLTVTIDEDNLIDFKYNYLTYSHEFKKMLVTFNGLIQPKMPVIGFFDNSSVIAIHKIDQGGYKFLDEWNGVYGTDLYYSFGNKKHQFGKTAMEALKTRNTFVVFDLLKIMSMPSDDIKVEKHWGFNFTKDAQNPVLLQFNTFEGSKKTASPSFLMALILRQHLKVIKAHENGEKPKKIGLYILQKFSRVELDRISEGLQKACELLKIKCVFIETLRFEF